MDEIPRFHFDHLMLKVADLSAARAAMHRLGFVTSPYRTNDPMGGGRTGGRGGNHLVMFEPMTPATTNMLELAYCDMPHAMPAMREVLEGPEGFAMMVVSPEDLGELRQYWVAQGFAFSDVIEQRFDWQDPETGDRDVIHFKVIVPTAPDASPFNFNAARLLDFSHYERPAWKRHPNTARHWVCATVAVADAAHVGAEALLRRIYGSSSLGVGADGAFEVQRGDILFRVMAARDFAAHYACVLDAAAGGEAAPCHSAVTIAVDSLAVAADVLAGNGVSVVTRPGRLLCRPRDGCGAIYEFVQRAA